MIVDCPYGYGMALFEPSLCNTIRALSASKHGQFLDHPNSLCRREAPPVFAKKYTA